jgi:CheY-like chemotaxis protein
MKNPPASFANHKNILLVDANLDTRDARAQMLRSRGATVDEVSGVVGARARFQANAYNLVLIDPGSDLPGAERLAEELKAEKPRQLVAFFVGGPHYVSLTTTPPRGKAKKLAPPPPAASAGSKDFGQQVRDIEAAEAAAAPATTLDALNAEDVA